MSPGPGSGAALAGVRLRFLIALAGVIGMVALVGAATAQARPKPHLEWIHCSPAARCPDPATTLRRTWKARVAATNVTRRARVVLHVRTGARPTRRLRARLVKPGRLVVRIPQAAVTGRVRVVMPGRRWSNAKRARVRAVPHPTSGIDPTGVPAGDSPFSGNGMWIWNLPRSDGGVADAIGERARAHDVTTVFMKSSDGRSAWSQFNAATVSDLKAQGLHVCAWQYVYGDSPVTEARRGADAVEDGADCLVIDAESEYEGKYAQAHTYMTRLRAAVGADFPIGLAGFPYADYHPGYPYSVFLGPGGATVNVPQVYWKLIGTSVPTALAHTYEFNQPYARAIAPLGQTSGNTLSGTPPPNSQILDFRRRSAAYGATGVSWWVYEGTHTTTWNAVGQPFTALGAPLSAPWPELSTASHDGDLVVWLQEHLVAAGHTVTIDGDFGPSTRRALKAFQTDEGLTPTGVTDTDTWAKLLTFEPVVPTWAGVSSAARAAGAATGPKSARLPARRNEIAGHRRLAAAR